VNLALFAVIGPTESDGSYTGALLSIYIFMIIIGVQAAVRFLPFALTLGVSRRTHYLGTIALIIGSGLFALASLRGGRVSRVGAILLIIGAAAALPLLFGVAYSNGPGDAGSIIAILGIFAFAGGWVWLGIGAIRTDRAAGITSREAIP